MTDQQKKRCGRFQGRKELFAHLAGKKLSYKKICLAKCYECMSGYADGAVDCRIPNCPIYPRMPYRGKNPDSESPIPPNSTI